MKLVDVHAHLTDEKFAEDFEEVIFRAVETGVTAIISAGTDLESSKKAVELAKTYKNVYAVVGVHPEDITADLDKDWLEKIESLARNEKVVGIGEIGLEYHFFDGLSAEEIERTKSAQKEAFVAQIELANRLNLPIVVHSRDAMGDTIEILRKHPPKRNSLLHCYSGSLESARELMKLGFSFSFGGVVTFKNAKNVQEVVKNLPLERILLETDCPYLSPEPYRGQRNEPKNVVYVADAIARLKGISIEEVAEITTKNLLFFLGKEK